MLSGAEVKVNVAAFQNDTEDIKSKDDVLTYMIHLGYLGYNEIRKTAFVPNEEIRQELTTAVESKKWNEMLILQLNSENLLDATLDMDGVAVAEEIEKIHNEHVSVIQYNNENSLSSVLTIAYLSAMQYYFKPIREFPTGRGFADFVFIPKPEYKNDYPALLVELKWNQNAQTALTQIKTKKYPSSILNYTGDILLVGINYDKKSKEHQCLIEKYEKIDIARTVSNETNLKGQVWMFSTTCPFVRGMYQKPVSRNTINSLAESSSRSCVIRTITEPSSATFISSIQGYLVPNIS